MVLCSRLPRGIYDCKENVTSSGYGQKKAQEEEYGFGLAFLLMRSDSEANSIALDFKDQDAQAFKEEIDRLATPPTDN